MNKADLRQKARLQSDGNHAQKPFLGVNKKSHFVEVMQVDDFDMEPSDQLPFEASFNFS